MAYDFPDTPTIGQVYNGYTWDGEKWAVTFNAPNQSGVIAIKVFTASGTYTPSANMTTCVIECVGGGGGGGGAASTSGAQICSAGGGGGGGYSKAVATAAAIGASQTVTVGTGGTAGPAGTNAGGAGGTTSVGALLSATGGAGAPGAPAFGGGQGIAGGAGGVGSLGSVNLNGKSGTPSFNPAITGALGGAGGDSFFGYGAPGLATATNVVGATAVGSGGGGSGGANGNTQASGVAGGAGAPGLVVITEYGMTALSSTTNAQGAVRFDLPQGLTTTQQAQARSNTGTPGANVVINGDFRINQGGYVSAAVLAAGAYGHDQWKAGASGGDYSFTQLSSSTVVTIASGKSLIQPIEDVRVVGGSYVLTWTGTAQARAGVNTLTPSGSYAASPLLISGQTTGTVMSVEFNNGTLGTVKLELGAIATPFVMPDFASELLACQRYWQPVYVASDIVAAASGVLAAYGVVFSPQMRTTPTSLAPSTSFAPTNMTATPTNIGPKGFHFQTQTTASGRCFWYGAYLCSARL